MQISGHFIWLTIGDLMAAFGHKPKELPWDPDTWDRS